ncbi:hypothetical protein RJT34_23814 [Clitoria ternatea]|uniref:MATH domain-containing protein n=1 Tax=Clitoria ternatea TaxID=43366 RepID=A0AAN9FVB3_CLITE
MENQRENDKTFEKFTWKIKEFSKLASEKLYSESFFIDGHTWQIVIFPKRKEGRYTYLSIYLNAGDAATLPCGWSKSATFKVSLVNQINAHMTLTRGGCLSLWPSKRRMRDETLGLMVEIKRKYVNEDGDDDEDDKVVFLGEKVSGTSSDEEEGNARGKMEYGFRASSSSSSAAMETKCVVESDYEPQPSVFRKWVRFIERFKLRILNLLKTRC